MRSARSFPPEATSVTAARRFVQAAAGELPKLQRDAISVMVSELAMNAVQHARTYFRVSVERADGMLRVEVTDAGPGTAALQPLPPASSLHGRGLPIVQSLSDAWGVGPGGDGTRKSVWFRVGMTAAAPSASR